MAQQIVVSEGMLASLGAARPWVMFIAVLGFTFMTFTAYADRLNDPPWPYYLDGHPIDDSANQIDPPSCWRYVYATPYSPHGTGMYSGQELQLDYVPWVNCASPGAVLRWPDPRVPVPVGWQALPRVGDDFRNLELYCVLTGKDYITPLSKSHGGALYQCQLTPPTRSGY